IKMLDKDKFRLLQYPEIQVQQTVEFVYANKDIRDPVAAIFYYLKNPSYMTKSKNQVVAEKNKANDDLDEKIWKKRSASAELIKFLLDHCRKINDTLKCPQDKVDHLYLCNGFYAQKT